MRGVIRVVAATMMVATGAVQASDAGQRLEQFLSGLNTLRADFNQTVQSADAVDESHGQLLIARPGKFRLQYDEPYEQLYVADGRKLWLYDKDLAQVTVKSQSGAVGDTPALFLSNNEPLSKRFIVRESGTRDGLDWVELKPRDPNESFEAVRLGLAGATLKVMDMADSFGQHTRIEFKSVERNVKIDPAQFRFTPPKGVDVVGADQ
jgi:chaperone LolA